MAKPKYSKRDYELVARIIKSARETIEGDQAQTAIGYVLALFAQEFREDNAAFDAERFMKACWPDTDKKGNPPLY